jgi:hypothetical protein
LNIDRLLEAYGSRTALAYRHATGAPLSPLKPL